MLNNSISSQRVLTGEVFQPSDNFHASGTALYCGPQSWTQYSRWGLGGAQWENHLPCPGGHWDAFCAASTHCWFKANFSSTRMPKSSAELLSIPQYVLITWINTDQYRALCSVLGLGEPDEIHINTGASTLRDTTHYWFLLGHWAVCWLWFFGCSYSANSLFTEESIHLNSSLSSLEVRMCGGSCQRPYRSPGTWYLALIHWCSLLVTEDH